jgi:hypothetical protein
MNEHDTLGDVLILAVLYWLAVLGFALVVNVWEWLKYGL